MIDARILETITHFAAALEMPSIKVDISSRSKKDQQPEQAADSKSPQRTFAG